MPIKVLLVIDHGLLREGVLALLKGQDGVRVIGEAADGREAVLEAKRLSADVVLMDASLPGVDGIAAIEALAQSAPGVQVLVLSMHESPDVVLRALEAGARGYLSRKSGPAELVKALQSVASGKRYLGSGIAEDVLDALPTPRPAAGALGNLTDTERKILQLTVDGKSNTEMAGILSLSHRTVETYRLLMMRKLGLRGLPALVKFAIRHGLTTVD
jgi:DNA-binding NarL/FixJ family response regulator